MEVASMKSKRLPINGKEDGISKLPDALLYYILPIF